MPLITSENTVHALEIKIVQVKFVMGHNRDCEKFLTSIKTMSALHKVGIQNTMKPQSMSSWRARSLFNLLLNNAKRAKTNKNDNDGLRHIIDNGTRHHSGQNLLWTHETQSGRKKGI